MANDKNRFPKPVAFNRNKPIDQAILKHVAKRNFSGYVKKLILSDMTAKGIDLPINTKAIQKKESAADKMERMKEELKGRTNNVN